MFKTLSTNKNGFVKLGFSIMKLLFRSQPSNNMFKFEAWITSYLIINKILKENVYIGIFTAYIMIVRSIGLDNHAKCIQSLFTDPFNKNMLMHTLLIFKWLPELITTTVWCDPLRLLSLLCKTIVILQEDYVMWFSWSLGLDEILLDSPASSIFRTSNVCPKSSFLS